MKTYDLETKEQELIAKQKLDRQTRITLRTLQVAKRPVVEKTVILGDISSSMSGYKIDELKRCLHEVWSPGLDGIVFGSDIWSIVEQDISKLRATGSTHMLTALQAAWDEGYTHIILITDGEPTDADEDEILDIVRRAHTDIPIDTIGVGHHGSHDYNPDFLRQLSELTGGRFTDCGEPIMLTTIVQHLLEYKPEGLIEEGKTKSKGVIQL